MHPRFLKGRYYATNRSLKKAKILNYLFQFQTTTNPIYSDFKVYFQNLNNPKLKKQSDDDFVLICIIIKHNKNRFVYYIDKDVLDQCDFASYVTLALWKKTLSVDFV